MEFINGSTESVYTNINSINSFIDKKVKVKGIVHKIRNMSGFAFVILRTERDLIQCVYSPDQAMFSMENIKEGDAVVFEGVVIRDDRSKIGYEIKILNAEKKSSSVEEFPVTINQKLLNLPIDTNLAYRPLTLRHPMERAIFKIQEGIVRGFRDFLRGKSFTEIHTPKIVASGAEGGANIFELDYFGKRAYLAQSPQFYKQTMVGVFERVFEVAPVFRAEKHGTTRHLNEYISLDFEMGFIDDFRDIMEMETAMLQHIFRILNEEYIQELKIFNVQLPQVESIPTVSFYEAKRILFDRYKVVDSDCEDLSPEDERLLGNFVKEEYGSDFIFVTHFPSTKRPFYTMDDKENENQTLSFDLLFKGVEITTGGQRIHNYEEQVAKMVRKGLNVEDFESYLMIHKFGIPPHGGLGLGLERLTMNILNLKNVRLASLFPRDINRLIP